MTTYFRTRHRRVHVVTNDQGGAVSRMEYVPYTSVARQRKCEAIRKSVFQKKKQTGEVWFEEKAPGSTENHAPKYNSQEMDKESGLYFFNARHYDPEIARFVTADTVVDGEASIKGWNRYMYVGGNPIRYKDPTGNAAVLKRDARVDGSGGVLANSIPLISPGHSLIAYKSGGKQKVVQYGDAGVRIKEKSGIGPYEIKKVGLKDKLVERAVKNTMKSKTFIAKSYNALSNNCNDFTEAVFNEYKNLYVSGKKNKYVKKFKKNYIKQQRTLLKEQGDTKALKKLNRSIKKGKFKFTGEQLESFQEKAEGALEKHLEKYESSSGKEIKKYQDYTKYE